MAVTKSLENLSLGGVAAVYPQAKMPKKYRIPKKGEVSTYQGRAYHMYIYKCIIYAPVASFDSAGVPPWKAEATP